MNASTIADVEPAARELIKEVERYMRLVQPSVAGGCDVERALEKCKDALAAASRNTAAQHEALSAALEQVNKVYDILSRPCVVIEEARQGCREARGVLIPALSAPRRNCDVGTPEEQDRRFDAFCKSYKEHHGNCFGCAALRTSGDCKVSWMRMPCEEKGSEG